MSREFNLFQHRKDVEYVAVPNQQGICTIWDWSYGKNKYIRRTEDLQYYAYKRVEGVQKSKCFVALKEARHWRESVALYLDDTPQNQLTFKEVKQRYFQHSRTKVQVTTFETYESNGKHLWYFDSLPVAQIRANTIDAWLEEIKKPDYLKTQHSNRVTYQAELSLLGYILKYYSEYCDDSYQVPIKKRHREDCIVDYEKYKLSKMKNQERFIPREAALAFLEQMNVCVDARGRSRPDWIFYDTIAEFQFGSGTRIGEACAIQFTDVLDWDVGAILISKTVQWSRKKGRPTRISPLTKNGEKRVIYLSERALTALKKWKLQCGRASGLVFSFDGSTPVGYTSIQKRYDAAFESLKMDFRSTHILRHSFATDFLEKTKDKPALQGQLGHKTSKQTDHYAKVTQTSVQEGVKAYNDRVRGSNVVDLFSATTPIGNPDTLGGAGWKKQSPQNQ